MPFDTTSLCEGDRVTHTIQEDLGIGVVLSSNNLPKMASGIYYVKFAKGIRAVFLSRLTLVSPKLTNKDKALAEGLSVFEDEDNLSYRHNQLRINSCDQEALDSICELFLYYYPLKKASIVISMGPHGLKYDVCIPNVPGLVGLNHKLKIYFNANGKRNSYFQIQIGSKQLAEYLIARGVVPELEGHVQND